MSVVSLNLQQLFGMLPWDDFGRKHALVAISDDEAHEATCDGLFAICRSLLAKVAWKWSGYPRTRIGAWMSEPCDGAFLVRSIAPMSDPGHVPRLPPFAPGEGPVAVIVEVEPDPFTHAPPGYPAVTREQHLDQTLAMDQAHTWARDRWRHERFHLKTAAGRAAAERRAKWDRQESRAARERRAQRVIERIKAGSGQ